MESSITPDHHEKNERLVAWTKRKVHVHMKERDLHFEEREIWWTSLGENVGSEANGKHDHFRFRDEDRWAVLAQMRTMSSKRLVRRMGHVAPGPFTEIRKAFISLIQTNPQAS